MIILGVSALYHDSAAALVIDGHIVAAAQEERFTRIKHDAAFPDHAISYCLEAANIAASDIDYVVFYEKPFRKLERILETYLNFAPRGFHSFRKAVASWAENKLFIRRQLKNLIRNNSKARVVFTSHHESHAASAFFPSPFEKAAILTVDGVGEWATATCGVGSDNHIQLEKETLFPHSIGLLYSAFTYHCGFKVNSGEYKLMGLAPFGKPRFTDKIHKHLIHQNPDGSFWMDMQYFDYCAGLRMTNRRFSELFGIPPRQPESKITPEYMDLAASVQQVTEQLMLQIVAALHKKTSTDSLVMAGGVALNCVANGRILRESPFRNLWIQPASGDAGGALGAAMFVWYQLLGQPRKGSQSDRQHGSLLGPNFQQQTIEEELRKANLAFRTINKEADLVKNVAQLLDEQNVVGWFQGRMEFGPRALGNRSILADPRSEIMQSKVNTQIKYRESFRPFAPIILAEDASDWFEIASDQNSPYMLIVAPVKESRRTGGDNTSANQADLIQRVQCRRSEIPAVTHVDYSARLQTVEKLHNPKLHHLLTAFKQRTDCPVLINTSFNVRGEPIVCSPADAIRCFASTEMDVLVLGNSIVTKKNNPQLKTSPKAQEFSLD